MIKRELGRRDPALKGELEQRVNIVVHKASSAGDLKLLKRHYPTNQWVQVTCFHRQLFVRLNTQYFCLNQKFRTSIKKKKRRDLPVNGEKHIQLFPTAGTRLLHDSNSAAASWIKTNHVKQAASKETGSHTAACGIM